MNKNKKKVLVVEDSERWCTMLETVFGSRGYEVDIARSTEDGWTRATSASPDLIIIDIIMPGAPLGGIEFARRLADEGQTRKIPRLFFTVLGIDLVEDPARTLSQGLFTKPVDLPRLIARVDELLRETGENHD